MQWIDEITTVNWEELSALYRIAPLGDKRVNCYDAVSCLLTVRTGMAIHKLRALEYLVAVIEHGGFAAAGRRLGVAAPSIHRLVSALESELGLPLLDRSSSPIRPTRLERRCSAARCASISIRGIRCSR